MINITKKKYYISLILVFVLGVGSCFGAIYVTGLGNVLLSGKYERFSRLSDLEEILRANFYKEITDSAITTGLNRGLFASVGDPYTVYYTKEEFEIVTKEAHGENSGIGVVMQGKEGDLIEIIRVIEDTPAEAAGIKAGDKILTVDGEEFNGAQSSEAASKVRGEVGTEVKITVLRDDEEIEFTIIRDNFTNPTVSAEMLDDNIGYISVSSFNDNTAKEFQKELESFESKKVSGLVIDIRNNVGGLVSQGVAIADLLLDEAKLAYAENNRKEKTVYSTEDGKTSLPYVLLVNGNTASTSEILAVGVKENKGGPLVGETTFGKGLIQQLEQFDQGDGARITIMQYFSASGDPINNIGVAPNYKVELKEDSKTDIQLEKAISLLKQ